MREGKSMIRVYFQPDGEIIIDLPNNALPDRETIERLAEIIRQHKEKPSENSGSQKGKAD